MSESILDKLLRETLMPEDEQLSRRIRESFKPKSFPKGACFFCEGTEPAIDYCINCDRAVCEKHCHIDKYDKRPYCPDCI